LVKVWRWKDVDVGHAEVVVDVLVGGVGEDLGMYNGAFVSLVHPRVQGSHVHVIDLFALALVDGVVRTHGVGSATEKGIAWF